MTIKLNRRLKIIFLLLFLTDYRSYAQTIQSLESLLSQIKMNQKQIETNLQKVRALNSDKNLEIFRLGVEMGKLFAEMQKVMTEMREGYYCDQCWNSKTQIEKGSTETFEQHLDRVNGTRVAAPQDKLDAKEAEYSAKIKNVRDRKFKLENEWTEYDDKVKRLNDENENIKNQIIPDLQKKMTAEAEGWRDRRYEDLKNEKIKNMESALASATKVGQTERILEDLRQQKARYNKEYLDKYQIMLQELENQYIQEKSTLERGISNKAEQIQQFIKLANSQEYQATQTIGQMNKELNSLENTLISDVYLTYNQRLDYQKKIDDKRNLINQAQLEYQKLKDYNQQRVYTMNSEKQTLQDNLSKVITSKPQIVNESRQKLDEAFKMKEQMINDAINYHESILLTQKQDAYKTEMERHKKSQELQDKVRKEITIVNDLCAEGGASFSTNTVVFANDEEAREHYYNLIREAIMSLSKPQSFIKQNQPCIDCPNYKDLMEEGEAMIEIMNLFKKYTANEQESKEYKRKEAQEKTDTQFDILIQQVEKKQ